MNSSRRISVTAGLLLVLATAGSLIANSLVSALSGADYLSDVARSGSMATSLLLSLLAAGSSVGIAVALYAVLHRTHPPLVPRARLTRTTEELHSP